MAWHALLPCLIYYLPIIYLPLMFPLHDARPPSIPRHFRCGRHCACFSPHSCVGSQLTTTGEHTRVSVNVLILSLSLYTRMRELGQQFLLLCAFLGVDGLCVPERSHTNASMLACLASRINVRYDSTNYI